MKNKKKKSLYVPISANIQTRRAFTFKLQPNCVSEFVSAKFIQPNEEQETKSGGVFVGKLVSLLSESLWTERKSN